MAAENREGAQPVESDSQRVGSKRKSELQDITVDDISKLGSAYFAYFWERPRILHILHIFLHIFHN